MADPAGRRADMRTREAEGVTVAAVKMLIMATAPPFTEIRSAGLDTAELGDLDLFFDCSRLR